MPIITLPIVEPTQKYYMIDSASKGNTDYNGIDITGYDKLQKISIVEVVPQEGFLETYLPYIIMLVVLFISGFMLFRLFAGKSGGANTFTRNRARMVEKCNVKFSDIAGAEEEKEETREIVEFLKDPAKFKASVARIPKGIFLVGNTGTAVYPRPTSANPVAGSHLHFQMLLNGSPVNPEKYLPSPLV